MDEDTVNESAETGRLPVVASSCFLPHGIRERRNKLPNCVTLPFLGCGAPSGNLLRQGWWKNGTTVYVITPKGIDKMEE